MEKSRFYSERERKSGNDWFTVSSIYLVTNISHMYSQVWPENYTLRILTSITLGEPQLRMKISVVNEVR